MHYTDADPEDQPDQTEHRRDHAGADLPRVGDADRSLGGSEAMHMQAQHRVDSQVCFTLIEEIA